MAGLRVAVLGVSYRGGVKETAFSGVFPTTEALRAAGAEVVVQDPLYDDAELEKLGFTPYHFGDPVDAAIIQADHVEYRELRADDLPGLKVLVDGRDITDRSRWAGTKHISLGRG